MKKSFKKKQTLYKGFTLVELLISTFLILAITSIVMSIFVAGLRGTTKASTQEDVRQNGDLALFQITRMIRNAKSFNGVKADGETQYSSSCYSVSGSNPTPTPKIYKAIKVSSFDGGVTEITCPAIGETTITSKSASLTTPAPLTDTNKVNVLPDSCYFTCQQDSPTDLPVVGISFTVQSKSGAASIDQGVAQVFQTSVVPRNFLR